MPVQMPAIFPAGVGADANNSVLQCNYFKSVIFSPTELVTPVHTVLIFLTPVTGTDKTSNLKETVTKLPTMLALQLALTLYDEIKHTMCHIM